MKKIDVKIVDKLGMHARPAGALVSSTSKFTCDIKLVFNDKEFNAKSIMGIMSAGIKCDNEISIVFDGVDEDIACESVQELLTKEGLI